MSSSGEVASARGEVDEVSASPTLTTQHTETMTDKEATSGPVTQSTEKTGGIQGAGPADSSANLTTATTIVVAGASGDLAKKKVRPTLPLHST
jgi:hypothetical protein